RQRLLRHYLWYWSGQDAASAVQKRLDAESRAQREGVELDIELNQIADDGEIRANLDEYRNRLTRAIDDMRLSDECVNTPLSRFCFHCLHLTNNRMGIPPMEEAYLSALLLAPQQGGVLRELVLTTAFGTPIAH